MKKDKQQGALFFTIPADPDGKEINIPLTLDGLELAAEMILDKKSREPVIEFIKTRRRWRSIKNEYVEMKKKMKGYEAIKALSEKHNFSEKTIEAIIYNR